MKLIFSRKGMDSAAGGLASPILPDGRCLSLPIPGPHQSSLSDWPAPDWDLSSMVADLSRGRLDANLKVHADPQLIAPVQAARRWTPSLGQHGSAQSHLDKQGVTVGDCFLFYGWFREVEQHQGRWRYRPGAPDLHGIFGWLRIGEILDLNDPAQRKQGLAQYPSLAKHPHVADVEQYAKQSNRLYLPADSLKLGGNTYPGAGHWRRLSDRRVLTWPGSNRSLWRLPAWMSPQRGSRLSAHDNEDRWQLSGPFTRLSNVPRGQEFVLQSPNQRNLKRWLSGLFESDTSYY